MSEGPEGRAQGPSLALSFLRPALDDLARRDLLRTRARCVGGDAASEGILSLTSNDYLGYAARPARYPFTDSARTGAGAARLVFGTTPEHDALETALATFLRTEDALLFSSGYAANLGLLSCLAGPGDLIVSDRLNHASLIDGARLSKAAIAVVPHRDAAAVARALEETPRTGRAFVVTETYFSMDGDKPDLPALREITRRHGAALLVDEAHALGLFGEQGRGLCAEAGVVPDALVGTFGKSFGASGAFVAGSADLVSYLWNRARSFVFSTGISPLLASVALAGLVRAEADDAGRARVLAHASRLRRGLRELGYEVPDASFGPIVPVLVGEAAQTVALAQHLEKRGVRVIPIRPPTVPEGTSRLRLTVHAGLAETDVNRALEAFASARG